MNISTNLSLAGQHAHRNWLRARRKMEFEGYTPERQYSVATLESALYAGERQESMECVKRGKLMAEKVNGIYARTPGQTESEHIGSIFKRPEDI